jgi:DNA helicase-2/ATP-dependent DNA helicase PcrA
MSLDIVPAAAAAAMAFTWSPQQEEVFFWFERPAMGQKNLVVRARAGTGKTTTILEGIFRAPEKRKVCAAFNKRIAEELLLKYARKIGIAADLIAAAELGNKDAAKALERAVSESGCDIKTLHSIGYALVRLYREKVFIEKRSGTREAKLAEAVCGNQAPDKIKRLVGKAITKAREILPHAKAAGELLDLLEEFELLPEKEWEDSGFGADYVEARTLEALELAAGVKNGEEIDFADMLFLPVRNGWLRPLYDLGVVDEAQDMTATQLELFLGVIKPDGRICIVGDDRQAIYAFRGADWQSLDRLKAELKAEELGLTVTRRCPKQVVAIAKVLVPDYEAAPDAPEGLVSGLPSIEKAVEMAELKDFFLSRSNAPIAKVAMALIRSNKRTRIQGKDIGAGLKALVGKMATGKAINSIAEMLSKLDRWEEKEVDRVVRANRPEQAENIRDKADTIRVLCEGIQGVRELNARLDDLFADKGADAVVCSSIHKAKGLEANRVFILEPTLSPKLPPSVKPSAARIREEQNIRYVAVTRAISHLVWVYEK